MPIFYEITAKHGQKSFLFGTVHFNDKKVTTLPLEVKLALYNARSFLGEVENLRSNKENMKALKAWKTRYSKEHHRWLGDTKAVNTIAQQSQPYIPKNISSRMLFKLIDKLPPIQFYFAIIAFNFPTEGAADILDFQLSSYATKCKKSVHYLETNQSQSNILMGIDFSYQEQRDLFDLLFNDLILNSPTRADIKKLNEDLINDYLLQNIDQDVSYKSFLKSNNPLAHRFFDKLIHQRDITMTQDMDPELQRGNAFVAVGAAHLKGIVRELQSKDYIVKPIILGERIYPVFDFRDRYYTRGELTGIVLIAGAAMLITSLLLPGMSLGLLIAGAALSAAAMVSAIELIYRYSIEPELPCNTSIPDSTGSSVLRV